MVDHPQGRGDVRVDVAIGEQVRLVDDGAVLAAGGATTVAWETTAA